MIENILDISTSHVTERDMLLLARETDFSVGNFDFGSFLFTLSNPETTHLLESYSKGFVKVHKYAKKHNCPYILLDRDADPEDTDELDFNDW